MPTPLVSEQSFVRIGALVGTSDLVDVPDQIGT